jgi:hypothetical protein
LKEAIMPNYTIRNKKTGEILGTQIMSLSELEVWERKNPSLEVAIGAPLIHSGRGMQKPDEGFRDLLKRIKKNSPGSTINDF